MPFLLTTAVVYVKNYSQNLTSGKQNTPRI